MLELRLGVGVLIILAVISVNCIAKEYMQWHLPEDAKLRLGKGEIFEIDYSPDGTRLAVASSVGIWLYDTMNYSEAALFADQMEQIHTIEYTLDGGALFSGGKYGGGLRLSDATTGDRILGFGAPARYVSILALNPDGSMLAIGSSTHGLELRDAKSGVLLHSLEGHTSDIVSLAFSPDGNMLASGSIDYSVRIWNTETGDELRAFEGREYLAARVVFNPHNGSLVIGRGGSLVEFWDLSSGENLLTQETGGGPALSLDFNSSGSQLALGTLFGDICVLDPSSGGRLYTLRGHTAPITSVAFSPNDQIIASGSEDGSVRFWDVETASQEHAVAEHFGSINHLAFGRDSDTLVMNASGGIHLFDTQTGKNLPSPVPPGTRVYLLALSPDGSKFAVRTSYGNNIWNAETGQRLLNLPRDVRYSRSLAFSHDSRLLAVGSDGDHYTVTLFDVETGELLHSHSRHSREVQSVAFSPDGRQLASGSGDRTVAIIDTRTGEHHRSLNFDKYGGVVSVAYSRDGRTFASATAQHIVLCDAVTWGKLHTLHNDGNYNCNVAFSPDSRLVARGSRDNRVRLWDVKTGELHRSMAGHTRQVNSVAFSPDGTMLASGDTGGGALLWEQTAPPTLATIVSLSPSLVPLPQPGEQFTMSLNISGGINVGGFQATILFDDKTLRFVDNHAGTFLGAGSIALAPAVDAGQVSIAGTAIGKSAQGEGMLAYLTFEVVEPRLSFVSLAGVGLSDPIGQLSCPRLEHARVIMPPPRRSDVNRDGAVDILDLVLVAANFTRTGENEADVNGDGVVGVLDLVQVAGAIGGGGAAPSGYSSAPSVLRAAEIESWIAQAQGLNPTSTRLQRGIRFLEQLLAALTPDETALLPNYPNPFNPETWIPYHLADGADVEITIYGVQGALVRRLALGYQAAGYYADRDRAAYWDGRNDRGESVASGVYVYQLQAGDYAAARRMVIVK